MPASRTRGERIDVDWVCAYYWPREQRISLGDLDDEQERKRLANAYGSGDPAWLQFTLPDLSRETQGWFEGSQDVWDSFPPPEVLWERVEPILNAVGLEAPDTSKDTNEPRQQLLNVLPHLYSRGIFRSAREVAGALDPASDIQLFSTVGFIRADEDEADSDLDQSKKFWTVRTNVAGIDNVVITIRLPDVLCSGRRDESDDQWRRPAEMELNLPPRFLPSRRPKRIEIAEGLAIHQAATARDACEQLRKQLKEIESEAQSTADEQRRSAWRDERERDRGVKVGNTEQKRSESPRDKRDRARILHGALLDLHRTVDQLDRQVSRLRRRFGSFGEETPAAAASTRGEGSPPQAVDLIPIAPYEIKLRYQFGLDELGSLREDCRVAESALEAGINARDVNERQRFELAIAFLGALVLTPTLVAGLYGANVDFPGENSTLGFWMLVSMLTGGLAGVGLLIGLIWSQAWDPLNFMTKRWVQVAIGVAAVSLVTLGVLLAVAIL